MARIEIDLPKKFSFSTKLRVRVSDLNFRNHVSAVNFLLLAQEARAGFFAQWGYTEISLGRAGTILSDTAIIYKGEIFLEDIVRVDIEVCDFHKYGFDVIHRLSNDSTRKDLAFIKISLLCYDYDSKKLVLIPEDVKENLASSQASD